MGRRARRRDPGAAPAASRRAPPAPRPDRAPRASRRDPLAAERPRAPWHPFPLVELSVLVGLVLLVVGLVRAEDAGGRVALVCGMALASLAGLETALREHLGGFRSHAVVLAALPAVLAAGILYFAGAPWIAVPLAGVAGFGAVFALARRAYRRHG